MLNRIESIQGVGLLHDANGKPHTCQKATLIYADNGRGKSTLATVLRSLAIGDATLISHRKTLDGSLQPKVVLQFENGHKVTFSENRWSEVRPEVLVFDADFVERNVHSGGSVNTEHRKNLLEFALGEAAVAARVAVDQATMSAKAASITVQNLTSELSGYHTGLTLAQFEGLPAIADADAQIVSLKSRVAAAANAATILSKPAPGLISIPTFDIEDLFSELGTSLHDVHADAERVVKAHALKLGGNGAEGWLSQGQRFESRGSCPYCGQETDDLDLIKAYQTHFNAAYAALRNRVAGLRTLVAECARTSIVDEFSARAETANAQAATWAEYVSTQVITFDKSVAHDALTELRNFILILVNKKEASPAEAVGSDADLAKAKGLWNSVVEAMKSTNVATGSAADIISAYKGRLSAENGQLLTAQISRLETGKRRHCLLYTSPSPRDGLLSRMPSSA